MTRSPLILAAVVTALGLGACGDSDDGGGTKSREDAAFEGALKFSRCMREHGIDMPDPQRVGRGGIKLTVGKINPNDPRTKAAQRACQKYMQIGGGETVDPARRAKLQEAALNYARCMRQHGVDMPDPQLGKGGLTFQYGGGARNSNGNTGPAVNPDSPRFKAADQACHQYLGKGGIGPSTQREEDK
jgi:hypothetical protein